MIFLLEMPVAKEAFLEISSRLRQAVADTAEVQDKENVNFHGLFEFNISAVNDQFLLAARRRLMVAVSTSAITSAATSGDIHATGSATGSVGKDRKGSWNARRAPDAIYQGNCTQLPDAPDSFVIVETEVKTTVGKVDDTWRNLNEFDLNRNLASSCLPPAVMTYASNAGGVVLRCSMLLIASTVTVVLMLN